MEHHADINSEDRYGRTVLFTFDDLGTEELILLIRHAVTEYHPNLKGIMFKDPTILTKSTWNKFWYDVDENIGDFLMSHGADVEHVSSVTIVAWYDLNFF